MRDHAQLYINGKKHIVRGSDIALNLSDYLRYEANLRGTKVVCAEGDCGACTVMVGRLNPASGSIEYQSINSCISLMGLLDGTHIVTIEGLKKDGEYHEIQKSMVENNGAQCGFCTPGFVMSLSDLYENKKDIDEKKCRNYLTGNLCRCTGYGSILDAALSVDSKKIEKLEQRYDDSELTAFIFNSKKNGIQIELDNLEFHAPVTFKEAVALKDKHPDIRIISSATDIGVQINKERFSPYRLLSLDKIDDAHKVEFQENEVHVGARVSLATLEKAMKDHEPEFSEFLHIFASPQIKNFGTLVGNIANGSPIGDTLPYLSVMGAVIVVENVSGEREIPFEDFYTGYKKFSMKENELIKKVKIPLKEKEEILKIYKVSRRKDLDISSVNAAIRMELDDNKIKNIKIAYGGVGPTILRLPKLEKDLLGKDFSAENLRNGSHQIEDEITPMSDVRGTSEYRYLVAKNLFQRFYLEVKGELDGQV